MGCASSKQSKCKHCKTQNSPMSRRSFSMNVHHPPEKKGDSYHMVALTSSTLGSIMLESSSIDLNFAPKSWDGFGGEKNHIDDDDEKENHQVGNEKKNKEFELGMIQAKEWSKMIDEKIIKVVPKTPIRTPPGEPETINVSDLMEGLEDNSPLRLGERHQRSFSFHVSADSIPSLVDSPRTVGGFNENRLESPKNNYNNNNKAWFDGQVKEDGFGGGDDENMISKALVSEFDPEVISAFRKALEKLSPTNPFHLKARDGVRDQQQVMKVVDGVLQGNDKMNGFVTEEKVLNGFVERLIAEEKDDSLSSVDTDQYAQSNEVESGDVTSTPTKERVILYFTSLRGVRTTYENCCYVRLVLKGLGVRVDERDVSMHSGFKEELKELLGEGFKGGLPKVFIGERYIGGTVEIRKLHEDGMLGKVMEQCERLADDGGNLVDVCDACGDIRFVPCETCSGSCKIYYECEHEDEDEDENEEHEEDDYGFQRCPDCNENGLIRCPICCY